MARTFEYVLHFVRCVTVSVTKPDYYYYYNLIIFVSFIKSQVTYRTCLQSKYRLYEIWPTRQANYTIGLGTTMQENQPAAQIAVKHSFFPQMAPYMSRIFLVLVGIDPGVSRLGGETVSHNTTDARR